jgi:putative SbcD/Mre11-related phosphoesterase
MNKNMIIRYVGKSILIETGKEKLIVIGDLHIGYGVSSGASGLLVANTLFERTIDELKEIFSAVGKVDEIILLGDIKHEFGKIPSEEWHGVDVLTELLRKNARKIIVIKGNHDILTDRIGNRLGFEVVDYYIKGETIFVHGNRDLKEIWDKKIKRIILGHIHPAVFISDKITREKYKCFLEGEYKGKEFVIVPSFTESNKGTDPRDFSADLPWPLPIEKFEVYAVGEEMEVFDFGKLKNIN